jgi:hypothetical protein
MKLAVEMDSGSIIYVPSFMKISRGVQAILRICVRNLKGYNVGINRWE